MNPGGNPFCVTILAGEVSGDQHGAKLVSAMKKKYPKLFFCGMGGDALRQAGVRGELMHIEALGESRPSRRGSGAGAMAANRRVDITLVR